jgi:hypothetical protein
MKISLWHWLAATALVVGLYLGSQAIGRAWRNGRLTQLVDGQMVRWETRRTGNDRFAIWVHYTYQLGEQHLEGADWLNDEVYRNPWTIERDMSRYPVTSVQVWHQSRHPERSALTKKSLRKPTVMALFALGLATYFGWMAYRLRSRYRVTSS